MAGNETVEFDDIEFVWVKTAIEETIRRNKASGSMIDSLKKKFRIGIQNASVEELKRWADGAYAIGDWKNYDGFCNELVRRGVADPRE